MKDMWSDRLRPKRASDLTLRKLSFRISCAQHDNKMLYRELNGLTTHIDHAHLHLSNSIRTVYTVLVAQCVVGFLWVVYTFAPPELVGDVYDKLCVYKDTALAVMKNTNIPQWVDFT